ncbi:MAG: group I truncated hemoglobin [Burkholderiaceae bacterium]
MTDILALVPALPARRGALVVALLATLSCAVLVVAPACGHAQPAGAASAPVVDDSLYRALGGQPGLERLAAALVPRLAADERIGPFFKHARREHLQAMLALKFCEVAGGGCAYTGRPLKEAHRDMDISRADFNALVEVLQSVMHDQGIPFATQNRLLARLAPLQREVVNVR